MIEIGKHHYTDIDQRRDFYKAALGTPPSDNNIYNYYLNMIGMVLSPDKPGFLDKIRKKKVAFPYSIKTKQEITKILMIVQADIIRQFDSISESTLARKIPDVDSLHLIFEPRERQNKIQQLFGCTHTGAPKVELLLYEINSLQAQLKKTKNQSDLHLQEIGAMKLKYIPETIKAKRFFRKK